MSENYIAIPDDENEAREVQRMPSPRELVEIVEKRDEFITKAVPIALASTRAEEWVNFGGKPYPQISACEKIMERFAISTTEEDWKKQTNEDEKGSYYVYVYEARFHIPGFHSYKAMGTCSSRDKLFGVKNKEFRPLYEISEANIVKTAKSNCYVNGTRGILGLRDISWQMLEAAGIKKGAVASVDYKGKAAAAQKQRQETQGETQTGKETLNADALKKHWAMMCEWEQNEGREPEALCERLLPFVKPREDGTTYATLEMVLRFKNPGPLKKLSGAIEKRRDELQKEEKLDAFDEFMGAGGIEDDVPY